MTDNSRKIIDTESLARPASDVKGAGRPELARPLPGPGPLLAAVSGGADSVCLLRLLAELAPARNWRLVVGHVDHGLRPDSGQDARFVAELAQALGLEFRLSQVRVEAQGRSPEEAARLARRQALLQMARQEGAELIALAHSADDQAETVLGRALTGSGPTGLAGMRILSKPWWRPLLDCRRQQLRAYLLALGQVWREDPSNQLLGPLRNRLRWQVMPLLEEQINPRAARALARLARLCADEEDFWDAWCAEMAAKAFQHQGTSILLRDRHLQGLHPVQLRRLLRLAAARITGQGQHLLSDQVARLLDLWRGAAGRQLSLGAGLWAGREPHGLRLDHAEEPPNFLYRLPGPGQIEVTHLGMTLQAEVAAAPQELRARGPMAWLPRQEVTWPLVIRPPRPGERFRPLGAPGRKRLSRFFIDQQVPLWWRPRSLVVEDAGGLWWVGPWAVDERARAADQVQDYIRLSLVDTSEPPPYTEV